VLWDGCVMHGEGLGSDDKMLYGGGGSCRTLAFKFLFGAGGGGEEGVLPLFCHCCSPKLKALTGL
jgi:hypothetical protein